MFPTRGSRRHRVGIAMASSSEKGCAKVERSPHVVMALAYCREVILGFGALHGIALYWRALLGIHCRCVAALCRSPHPKLGMAWRCLACIPGCCSGPPRDSSTPVNVGDTSKGRQQLGGSYVGPPTGETSETLPTGAGGRRGEEKRGDDEGRL